MAFSHSLYLNIHYSMNLYRWSKKIIHTTVGCWGKSKKIKIGKNVKGERKKQKTQIISQRGKPKIQQNFNELKCDIWQRCEPTEMLWYGAVGLLSVRQPHREPPFRRKLGSSGKRINTGQTLFVGVKFKLTCIARDIAPKVLRFYLKKGLAFR